MGPRKTPQKSTFWSKKWHFPDFLVRGSVEGRGGLQLLTCNPVSSQVKTLPTSISKELEVRLKGG